jgi:hypothetical protein
LLKGPRAARSVPPNAQRKEYVIRLTKALLPAALAAGLLATPAAATVNTGHVGAKAAGSDGPPPVLPSIVGKRINRGEKALDRAGDYVDREMPDKAVVSLRNARRNMYAAWRNAVDVVENTPPPPPAAADRVHLRVPIARKKAHGSAVYLGPEETAVAVLNFQHDAATAAFDLLDGAKGTLRDAVSTTMFASLNRRDKAILYIHNRPVPPPAAEAGRVHAHASDEDAPPSFATLMPGIVADIDDELGQIRGLVRGGALTPGEKKIMGLAKSQDLETKDQVNTWWPPLPVGDD